MMKDKVRIVEIDDKFMVGKSINMSLSDNRTHQLWRDFKSGISVIHNRVNSDFYSVQVYNSSHSFDKFNADAFFENWACVEVINNSKIPDEMEQLAIPKGKYAVFIHIGTAAEAFKTSRFIFEDWLPASKFQLDERPHFQIMEADYKPDDPKAKETFWVPISD